MVRKTFIDKMVKNLVEEERSLLAKFAKNTSGGADIDIDGDEIDEIQGTLIASIDSQLSTRNAQKLRLIQLAKKRIDENTFGVCEDCGDSISEKRLEINPAFSTCITCAEQREIDNRQRKG